MNKLAILFVVGAAALIGGSAANAADHPLKAQASTGLTQQSTDISAQRRHHHYGHRQHRGSYAYYAPRRAYAPPAYYAEPYGAYGYGGPVVSLGFGVGGLGFGGGHHHHHGW